MSLHINKRVHFWSILREPQELKQKWKFCKVYIVDVFEEKSFVSFPT